MQSGSDATSSHPQASQLLLPSAGNARNSWRREDRSSWPDQHTETREGGSQGSPQLQQHPGIPDLPAQQLPSQREREASQTAGQDEISPQAAASGGACTETSPATRGCPHRCQPGAGGMLADPTSPRSGEGFDQATPRMLPGPGSGGVILDTPGVQGGFI